MWLLRCALQYVVAKVLLGCVLQNMVAKVSLGKLFTLLAQVKMIFWCRYGLRSILQ